ncbi:unnamed protein product [Urochloa humidicola]
MRPPPGSGCTFPSSACLRRYLAVLAAVPRGDGASPGCVRLCVTAAWAASFWVSRAFSWVVASVQLSFPLPVLPPLVAMDLG